MIWDRKRDGGFPETKELKNRVRNIIEPGKDMGHVDRALRKGKEGSSGKQDESVDGQVKAGEASVADGAQQGGDRIPPEQSIKGHEKAEGKTAAHAEHKDGKSPPDDCEECKEALRSEGGG